MISGLTNDIFPSFYFQLKITYRREACFVKTDRRATLFSGLYGYLFLHTSYKKLHFCWHACLRPIVSGQSNRHDSCSALHLTSVQQQQVINNADSITSVIIFFISPSLFVSFVIGLSPYLIQDTFNSIQMTCSDATGQEVTLPRSVSRRPALPLPRNQQASLQQSLTPIERRAIRHFLYFSQCRCIRRAILLKNCKI